MFENKQFNVDFRSK
ncbi:hypothetical protein DW666_03875 [Streptococcus parasanguinis]|nr:hypothetical protein DW666_03875 [Streptococcus parasanguinis]